MPKAASQSPAYLPAHPGTYALVLRLPTSREIEVGKLGRSRFPAGFYVYVGSALGSGGLAGRLRRHRKLTTSPGWVTRWHIDYLRHYAKLIEIWTLQQTIRREHDWANLVQMLPGVAIPMSGFGSSDCSCLSHLFQFSHLPRHAAFRSLLASHFPEDDLAIIEARIERE